MSDIRINYEKYFYHEDALAKTSEKDKFVIEFEKKLSLLRGERIRNKS